MKTRSRISKAAALVLTSVFACSATAAGFPDKPLRMVVPFAPGGPTDIVGRAIAQRLTETFGQSMVVDNRAGAGGVVGADMVAKAAPDGYTTLLCSTGAMAINPGLMDKLPYDSVKDFAGISLVVTIPYLLLVSPSSPVKTVKELIAEAKSKPGSMNYGSAGTGSTSHLAGELFKTMAGIEMVHIPYKGSAPASIDLISGRLQTMFNAVAIAMPFVKGGKMRAIGISTQARSPLVPDVPTISESGVPGFEVLTWHGICAPSKTPKPVLKTLNTAIVQAVQHPQTRQHLGSIGADVVGSTQEEFEKFIKSELAKWSKIIKASGATAY
jgi:tripartite-type tricarboxylate transporter receptor subunit TctC